MFHRLLPVVICILGQQASAQTCEGSAVACVRVLACIGNAGLFVDGAAFGAGQGTLMLTRSDNVGCIGTWDSDGPFGAGIAHMRCDDGLSGRVLYHTQDNATGTVIGVGEDSQGRTIQAWSGTNVLNFLSETGTPETARLPCSTAPLPMS